MRLDEKARESLEAAERLLDTADGSLLPLLNVSASRSYYAAYLAVADGALQAGREFDSPKDYFKHDSLPDKAVRWALLNQEQRDDLAWLFGLRVKADYLQEASQASTVAGDLLRSLIGSPE